MKNYSNNISTRLSGRHKKCMQMVGEVKDKAILDIGSSFGWFEKFALENGCKEITGLEYDSALLSEAKTQISDRRARFIQGSALNLPFPDETFDMVTLFDVIEHIPKNTEQKALAEIRRVLKNGGEFYLSTPNKSFIANLFDPAWYFGHRHYSLKQLKNLCQKENIAVKNSYYGGGWWDIIYMTLLYFFKWVLRKEAPFKVFFDKKRDEEYLTKPNMFNIIFVKGQKNRRTKNSDYE